MFGSAEVSTSVQHRIQVSRLWVLEGEAHAPVKGIRDVPFADTTKTITNNFTSETLMQLLESDKCAN